MSLSWSAWVNAWVSRSCADCTGMPSAAATEVASELANVAMMSLSGMPRSSWSLMAWSSAAPTGTAEAVAEGTSTLRLPANSAATESPSWALKSAPALPDSCFAAVAPGSAGPAAPEPRMLRSVVGFRVSPPSRTFQKGRRAFDACLVYRPAVSGT